MDVSGLTCSSRTPSDAPGDGQIILLSLLGAVDGFCPQAQKENLAVRVNLGVAAFDPARLRPDRLKTTWCVLFDLKISFIRLCLGGEGALELLIFPQSRWH